MYFFVSTHLGLISPLHVFHLHTQAKDPTNILSKSPAVVNEHTKLPL